MIHGALPLNRKTCSCINVVPDESQRTRSVMVDTIQGFAFWGSGRAAVNAAMPG